MNTNYETIRMLERGVDEIERLRKANTELQTKAMAFDMLRTVLGMIPHPTQQGYGVDIAWRMQQHSDELRKHDVSFDEFPNAEDAAIDEALAGEPQPARPLRTHRECECPEGPCRHDALDQWATVGHRPAQRERRR